MRKFIIYFHSSIGQYRSRIVTAPSDKRARRIVIDREMALMRRKLQHRNEYGVSLWCVQDADTGYILWEDKSPIATYS